MTQRRQFAASIITTFALAGCGGGGSKTTHTENPPTPHVNPPKLSSWTVKMAGNGQCYASDNKAIVPDERVIECPSGVDMNIEAQVRETEPGVCVAVLDPCGDSCDELSAPCPDPELGVIERNY